MLHSKLILLLTSLLLASSFVQSAKASEPVAFDGNTLHNGIITVDFDLPKGTFSVFDAQNQDPLLTDAAFALPSGRPPAKVNLYKVEEVADPLGIGKRVVLIVTDWNLFRYSDHKRSGRTPSQQLFTYTLYQDNPALILGFGLKTQDYISHRLTKVEMLADGLLFGGKTIRSLQTLNGAAGAEPTTVESAPSRISVNNLMLTAEVDGERRSAVWGGLKYNEFAAVALFDKNSIGFYAEDPVGRLINEGEVYIAEDTYYLDIHTREPFEALERYGLAMRAANNAKPNVYDFPITCGWSVSHISKLPDINNSAKLIQELEQAHHSGLTRYTDISLRLEPDKYHFDTEQGWWDDAHMRKFAHLTEPYDTIAKWSQAMQARQGIPYIYMQLGMPSDDFARAHPQFMLFNDASEVDRRKPGEKWETGKKHPHHQPYVTYDYTDKEFSEYFLKRWRTLREDGIRGVKVDYPATVWRPEGGFDDRYATCNSAYRRAFQLMREAFGPDGLIDERNIGESGRPCLDVTAGIVDTQRTWADSNKFVPSMVSISGLRWFKNRTVFNYYSDTKAVHDLPQYVLESMLTMNFLTSGRLDLSTSYSLFTDKVTHAVSRTYPHYEEPITARPLDAFTGKQDPQVYDLELTPDWHQIALYNTGSNATVVSTSISGQRIDNAIGLDPLESYHAYEFWSDTYLGKLAGNSRIEQRLEPNTCAMISLRKALRRPQVVSTDRHLLQGWVDLADIKWNAESKTLSGVANVIGGEPFTIIIANNGHKPVNDLESNAAFQITPFPTTDLTRLTLSAADSAPVAWRITYE